MARKDNDLLNFGVTQQYTGDFPGWTDDERMALANEDNNAIIEIMWGRLEKAGLEPYEAHINKHYKEEKSKFDALNGTVTRYVVHHFHSVWRIRKGATVDKIAQVLGIAKNWVEKPAKGPYGTENMIAYLIHAKEDGDIKRYYEPSEVISRVAAGGRLFMDYYVERHEAWERGRAKKKKQQAYESVDWVEEQILLGNIKEENIYLNDALFYTYATNKQRLDNAFASYGNRRAYRALDNLKKGRYQISIFYVTGKPRTGKSYFSERLAQWIQICAQHDGQGEWGIYDCSPTNPIDDYQGEEIITLDDLRGMAMTASDWLNLLDPEHAKRLSARYKNKYVCPRVIIITAYKDVVEFFYYMKGLGSKGNDRSEAMDQFLGRIMKMIYVIKEPAGWTYRISASSEKDDGSTYKHFVKNDDRYGAGVEIVSTQIGFEKEAVLGMEEAKEFLMDSVRKKSYIVESEE